MSMFAWLRKKIAPSTQTENKELVDLINKESEKLNDAVVKLEKEVKTVKKERTRLVFEDMLEEMKRDYRQ